MFPVTQVPFVMTHVHMGIAFKKIQVQLSTTTHIMFHMLYDNN